MTVIRNKGSKMSRSKKGGKGPGYEYGKSRLHKGYEEPGKYTKKLTHKKERRNGKVKDEQV